MASIVLEKTASTSHRSYLQNKVNTFSSGPFLSLNNDHRLKTEKGTSLHYRWLPGFQSSVIERMTGGKSPATTQHKHFQISKATNNQKKVESYPKENIGVGPCFRTHIVTKHVSKLKRQGNSQHSSKESFEEFRPKKQIPPCRVRSAQRCLRYADAYLSLETYPNGKPR